MERIVEQTMLYDFYGELLNEHQKSIYEQYVLDNLSLSEIAEAEGISRQGVHDLIKRIDKILAKYEDKLHLVERFLNIKECAARIKVLSGSIVADEDILAAEGIIKLTDEIIEDL